MSGMRHPCSELHRHVTAASSPRLSRLTDLANALARPDAIERYPAIQARSDFWRFDASVRWFFVCFLGHSSDIWRAEPKYSRPITGRGSMSAIALSTSGLHPGADVPGVIVDGCL